MAKLITKFKYLPPDKGGSRGGYAVYVATREGVVKIDESKRFAPATKKQKQLIENLLRDFPDARDMLEYEDYLQSGTIGSASEFITRALEDNAAEVLGREGYARYVATRPRAERYGSHGLFTDDVVEVQLTKVAAEMDAHSGNIWTAIISLRREDAERLDFCHGERWRDMLRTQTQALADNFKIPIRQLRWYAAYHNESHHPHAHLIVYSAGADKGWLTKQGVANLRSSIAGDIFAQDLQSAAEQQTVHRNELKASSRDILADIAARINTGGYDNPKVEGLLTEIAERLRRTKGKMVYGYLPRETKDLIDEAVEELAKDERIGGLYDLWYEQKEAILRTYTKAVPKRIPLSQNKEFKSIRNAVLQEALHLTADRQLSQNDEPDPEPPDIDADAKDPDASDVDLDTVDDDPTPSAEPVEPDSSDSKKWWSKEYKLARRALYGSKDTPPDFEQAYALMEQEAGRGNGYAMHDMGKILLNGIGRDEDEAAAQQWFQRAHDAFLSAEQTAEKKDYLQYRIGKLYSFGYGVEQSYESAAAWYEQAVADNNPYAAYSLGSLYHRGQGVEQDEVRAFGLFQMAAEHEKKPNAYAMYELGRMYKNGVGTAPDKTLSEQWYAGAYQGFVQMELTMNDDKLQYRLGKMSMTGVGTEKNLQTAFSYFIKSAALKNADAEYGLGRLLLNKDFERYDPRQAAAHLTTAAKAGHDAALYTLGKLFLQGREIEQDLPRALGYLEQAVEKENQYAQYLLGKTLLHGKHTGADPVRAEQLLRSSAAQGNACAMYTLGKAYLDGDVLTKNIPQALELLTAAAEGGNEFAAYTLGKAFLQGKGVGKDVSRALKWLEQAAAKDNPFAQYLLGRTLLRGEDVEADPGRAEGLLSASAAQGNPFAAYTLGKAYLDGTVLPQNLPRAVELLNFASEQDMDAAQYSLGKLYAEGTLLPKDMTSAVELLTKAALHGNQYAQYRLGRLYLSGEDIPKDIPAALFWLTKAAEQNNPYAQYQLGRLYLYGQEVDRDADKAAALLTASAAQGNPFAAQLLKHYRQSKSWTAAMGAFRLLQHAAKAIGGRVRSDADGGHGTVDRKLRRQIDEKKLLHGMRIE